MCALLPTVSDALAAQTAVAITRFILIFDAIKPPYQKKPEDLKMMMMWEHGQDHSMSDQGHGSPGWHWMQVRASLVY